MSDLSKLARKAKKEKVGKHEITIMPLSMSDMDLFEKGEQDPKKGIETTKKIIKESIPGATEEEVNNMSMEYMMDLQEAIMRVNNIDEKKVKEKTKVLQDIKKEQDAKPA